MDLVCRSIRRHFQDRDKSPIPQHSVVVTNKLEVAAYYTAQVAAGCAYGTEQDGLDALSAVTADPATVVAAKAAINGRCGP